ncbi:endo alpha-1,4 polygalactosaminidase [Herpetosiphon geysericola]|uniref:endo alpha-1,4 polygalactosaminidase n=1 Tax=Herpetosiphon geysericola TaxID=70996 RepID=UPI0006C8FFD3|nr:endo alpha-1,4 polygalactosaminidase [Herpetosiphon geysericola]
MRRSWLIGLGLGLILVTVLFARPLSQRAFLPIAQRNAWWQPAVNSTMQLQFSGMPLDLSHAVTVYDVDLFDTSSATVSQLQSQGRRVVCYINVGAWEDWRADANAFPSSVLGNDYEGWPGEKWLDIRQIELLAPIMRARMDECKSKGFDGIEPDNINGYQNPTGFSLNANDQLAYNRWLANEAHSRGLSIGLKNDSEQVDELLAYYDWALTEDCFDQGWCGELSPFIAAGKPVFAIEYTDTGAQTSQFCPQARQLGINAMLKHRELDAYRVGCEQ